MKKLMLILFVVGSMVSSAVCTAYAAGKPGTMVFATKPVQRGKESSMTLKTTFTNKQPIYARAYLKKKIGRFQKEYNTRNKAYKDDFIAELYIDGAHKYTWNALKNEQVANPSYKQFQFFIYKTESRPDFPRGPFKRLSKGKHKVELRVIRKRLSGDTLLAKGKFNFIVK